MSAARPKGPVRIANCSGFYGDRLAAPREMLDGPDPIDVLTGDYLAELTMLILWKARQKDPGAGYATTFVRQMEDVLGTCLDRGVKVVTNAGGLNPSGLAARLDDLAGRLGLSPRIAVVEGDDILDRLDDLQAAGETLAHLDTGQPLAAAGVEPVTANAYLGGWGISAALVRRGRRGRVPAGHRRVARRRSGRLVARLGPRRLGPPRRSGRRRPRHRVRPAGDRRQLLVPRRAPRRPLPGLPDRRGGRTTVRR